MKQGWEGLIYRGTAGSTAATLMTEVTEVTSDYDIDEGSTTVRGESTVPPIDTTRVTVRKFSAQVTLLENSSDASLTALRSAAANGTPIAIRMIPYSGGIGYDGDVNVKFSHQEPLRAEQTNQFTFTPNRTLRTPQLLT